MKINLSFLFRALQSRNYRLYFSGQGISLIGLWMQSVAISWLVYRLTNSPFMLGLVGFTSQFPMLTLTAVGGVLVDRWDRKAILIIIQYLGMAQAMALAILAYLDLMTIEMVIVLTFFWGVVSALDAPTRHALVAQLVEKKEDMGNAIALNSAMFNGARLIGPSIAGLIIAMTGEGVCFLINAVSYIPACLAFQSLRLRPQPVRPVPKRIRDELREGFVYARSRPLVRFLIILVMMISLFGMPYLVQMPAMARDVLGGGARELGFLLGAVGCGALTGAMFLASRPSNFKLIRIIFVSSLIFSLSLLVFSLSRTMGLSIGSMYFAGLGMMVQLATINTLMQSVIQDDKRGRIMGLYTMAFMGFVPFGSLLNGWLAGWIGSADSLLVCGLICLGISVICLFRLSYWMAVARYSYMNQ